MVEEQQERKSPTQASSWKGKGGLPLDLPSGNVALVRTPGMQHFIRVGTIPNSLRGLIQQGMSGKTDFDLSKLVQTEEDFTEMMDTFDKVLLEVVVEPKVHSQYDDEGELIAYADRDPDLVYVDEVVMEDKVFVFQFAVGGVRDLESFRQEQAKMLESVQSGEGMEVQAE